MESYRVLLVDDEEDIRVGISRKIDWEGLGYALVGEAENGRDALELAESLQPDVVLTDIKMPFMDGLELCRILTERLPASKFVVFSGFDDFEYAKQAIQMNVSEYILKPINAPELTAVLERLHSQLDAERAERRDAQQLRERYEESLPCCAASFSPGCWTAGCPRNGWRSCRSAMTWPLPAPPLPPRRSTSAAGTAVSWRRFRSSSCWRTT